MTEETHTKMNKENALQMFREPKVVIDTKAAVQVLIEFLKQDPNDKEIYDVIEKHWQSVQDNKDLLNGLETLINQNDLAKKVWLTIQGLSIEELKKLDEENLISEAENCYLGSKYHQAIQLYKEILRRDPNKKFAKYRIKNCQQLIEVKLKYNIPPDVHDIYKRHISPLNASLISPQDASNIDLAKQYLSDAVKLAEEKGIDFVDAKIKLLSLENATLVNEYMEKAYVAIHKNNWEESVNKLRAALEFGGWRTDEAERLLSQIQILNNYDGNLSRLEKAPAILAENVESLRETLNSLPQNKLIDIPLHSYRDQILSRLQTLVDEASNQLGSQSKSAFEQAKILTSSLNEKKQLYEKSVAHFETAAKLSSKFTPGEYVSEAKNTIELLRQVENEIETLKHKGRFPRGMTREGIQRLSILAPGDPNAVAVAQWLRSIIRWPKYGSVVFGMISLVMFLIAFLPGTLVSLGAAFVIAGIMFGLLSLLSLAIYFMRIGLLQR